MKIPPFVCSQIAVLAFRCPSLLLIMALGAFDILANRWNHLQFSNFTVPVAGIGLLLCVCLIYSTARPVPILAEASWFAALWVGFSLASGCLTYEANAFALPFQDDILTRIDRKLAFNAVEWSAFVVAHPALKTFLALAYASLMSQILFTIAALAVAGDRRGNESLLCAAAIAMALTCIGSLFLPALGAWILDAAATQPPYVADIMSLRTGQHNYSINRMQGIVSCPSYHTVLAILFCWALRDRRYIRWPILMLNVVMLISIPTEGQHYLIDMIAGAAVAFFSIVAVETAVQIYVARFPVSV